MSLTMTGLGCPFFYLCSQQRGRCCHYGKQHMQNLAARPKVRVPVHPPLTAPPSPLPCCPPTTRYWLGVGAHPSDRVTYLLSKAGLVPPPPVPPRFPKPEASDKKKG